MATTRIDEAFYHSVAAGADLTAAQHCIVRLDSSGHLVLAGAGERGWVLQDKPASGQAGTIALTGPLAKAIAGGTIVPMDAIAADRNGHIVRAATGNFVIGTALVPAVAGDFAQYESNVTSAAAA